MSIKSWVIELRRDFHKHPEPSWREERTSTRVEETLKSLGIETHRIARTGVLGILRGSAPGRRVALRADMDALELTERTGAPYASENPGIMHACGHDAHTASLLGAARALTESRDALKGDVVFLFQPAEEVAEGAKSMIEAGAMNGVDAVFGVHVFGVLPVGKVGIIEGPMLAGFGRFKVTFKGVGGHGAMPHLAVNTITPACQAYLGFQAIVSQEINPADPAVLTVGQIHGGTRFNVIADETWFEGSTRFFKPEVGKMLDERIERLARATAEAHRATATVEYQAALPPTINDPGMARLAREAASEEFGPDCLTTFEPVMGSEDFSFFANVVPGVFVGVGAGNVGKGLTFANHHPQFDIDEDCLDMATRLYAAFARAFLR
jgi:amidohydrolase